MSRLRALLAVVAGLASLAAVVIATTGGYEFSIAGATIRGHGVDRLVWLALLAFVAYVAVGGRIWRPEAESGASRWTGASGAHWLAVALSVAVFVLAWTVGSRAIGGADSWGYMSQAFGWLRGGPSIAQPWAAAVPWPNGPETFKPLGYSLGADGTTLVPIYSPGIPLIMAGLIAVAGPCAAFLLVPAAGAIAVYGTYRLGTRLATPWIGLGAAWLLASSPAFVYVLLQPMSDVPVVAAWIVAFVVALRRTVPAAFAAGLATAWAILIRINHAPFAVALVLWFAMVGWRREEPRRSDWKPMLAYGLGMLPGVLFTAAFNWHFHGSPLRSGYGPNDYLFQLTNIVPNLERYTSWLTAVQTPVFWAGVLAVIVPLRRWWPGHVERRMVACLALFVTLLWVQYCIYAVFDAWWFLRFLLVAFPVVFVGILVVARDVLGRLQLEWRVLVVGGLLVWPAIRGVEDVRYLWDARDGQAYFQTAARVVEAATEPGSVLIALQHGGSLRYYAGRMTVRYDYVDPAWLDRLVAWFAERGVRTYALLEAWEVDAWQERFGASSRFGRLDGRLLRRIPHSLDVRLYDLNTTEPLAPRTVATTPADALCRPPRPLPTPSWMSRPQ